jgi:hypothetical protein
MRATDIDGWLLVVVWNAWMVVSTGRTYLGLRSGIRQCTIPSGIWIRMIKNEGHHRNAI